MSGFQQKITYTENQENLNKDMFKLSDKGFKTAVIQRGSLTGNFNFIECNKNTLYYNMWDAAKAVLRGIYSTRRIYQKRRKVSDQLSKFLPQYYKKKSTQRGIINIKAEINEISKRKIDEAKLVL